MKSAQAGKDTHSSILKKLARLGRAGSPNGLMTDAALTGIEETLEVTLPKSYRSYLKRYAHRQIGAYEPFLAAELAAAVHAA